MRTGCGCAALLLVPPVVFFFAGFGIAAFLDSEREVLDRVASPGGTWTAQVERLTVGGAPNMVITVRRSWHPDWYLTSCKPVSYYGESAVSLSWTSDRELVAEVSTELRGWRGDGGPFRWRWPWSSSEGCDVRIHIRQRAASTGAVRREGTMQVR